LSAVLATSKVTFDVVRYVGAAYLTYLGIRMILERAAAPVEASDTLTDQHGTLRIYGQGVLTNVLNPKVALFFLAFLPQFVHPERGMVWLQFLVLGALLSVIGMLNSLILSFAVGRFGRRFAAGGGRWKERLTGSVFIALGLRLAVQQRG
jgi:threonine/homoserine/homoserine lactone efflux protein